MSTKSYHSVSVLIAHSLSDTGLDCFKQNDTKLTKQPKGYQKTINNQEFNNDTEQNVGCFLNATNRSVSGRKLPFVKRNHSLLKLYAVTLVIFL